MLFKAKYHILTDVCFRRIYVHFFQLRDNILFAFELSAVLAIAL